MRILAVLMVATAMAPCFAADLPTLPEAFGRGTPGAGGVATGQDLKRIVIPTQHYPDALCADGTPATFFVRSAREREHRDDWVIYLQGGGSCEGGEDCHARWLGRDGNFGANKLSSRFAPERGMAGGSIESPDARNPFAAWNQVFVYYCSSDGWAGQARDVATEAVLQGVSTPYRIHFLGARIIDAVIDQLRGGSGPLGYVDADGQRRQMPDLDTAQTVLLSGSSAGGSGVRSNADRVGDLLRRNRPDCAGGGVGCALRYAAVIDASYGLGAEQLDHAGSLACGAAASASCTYELSMRRRWFDVLRGFRNGVADESCETWHTPLGDPWRCADGNHVLEHHLMTPFFVRADLQDQLVMGNTLDAGYAYQGVPLDRTLYGMLEEIQLRRLAGIASRSEEPRRPSMLEPPGVFGPQCGDHETLRSDEPTFRRVVVDDFGEPRTMLDLLSLWLAGRQPSAAIQRFEPAGRPPGCNQF